MLTSEHDRFKLDPWQLWCHSQILGISVMVDVPSGPVSNLPQDLSTTHLHSSPLCCLQKINLNVFLSIWNHESSPHNYYTFFCSLKNKTWSYSVAQMGFKVTLKPQMLQVCNIPPASASRALTTGGSHHIWLTFTYICVYCFIFLGFFVLYFLPFIFISSVFATSLLIKHNFLHSNISPNPNILNLMHLN